LHTYNIYIVLSEKVVKYNTLYNEVISSRVYTQKNIILSAKRNDYSVYFFSFK